MLSRYPLRPRTLALCLAFLALFLLFWARDHAISPLKGSHRPVSGRVVTPEMRAREGVLATIVDSALAQGLDGREGVYQRYAYALADTLAGFSMEQQERIFR